MSLLIPKLSQLEIHITPLIFIKNVIESILTCLLNVLIFDIILIYMIAQ